jgi:iron complex outermembrane receptor protein
MNAYRALLAATVALGPMLVAPTAAFAEVTTSQKQETTSQGQEGALTEIIVTAQKREQKLQDVPIAVTALTGETLKVNRVSSVMDLAALAPNLTVHPSTGAGAVPIFGMRGLSSYGLIAGTDKEISIYLDGVYLGATRGSSFDLPDLERIEVLRGPQGTLFGRNATGGAISIITRDPPGRFGIRQDITIGDRNTFRSRTRIDTPAFGPITASLSYLHDERRGDIRNLDAGRRWDFSAAGRGIQFSPKWLGSKDSDVWFGAVKFEPSDDFALTYKFDHTKTDYTPEGVNPVVVNPGGLGPLGGGLLNAIISTQPTPAPSLINSIDRPKALHADWSTPGYTKTYGHNLTAGLKVSDSLSIKNIAAYRYTDNYGNVANSGYGGLVNTIPALGPVGAPFILLGFQSGVTSKQWSDELQLNYKSAFADVTVGGLYYRQKERSGSPPNMASVFILSVFPGGVVPTGAPAINFNKIVSKAIYGQAEVHVTSNIDLIGGYRLTQDDKTGTFISGGPTLNFKYKKRKPSYSVGVNYKPIEQLFIYAKYSTAFVSGGSIGPVQYQPETVKSWEAGVKADFMRRRLRMNLTAFDVTYGHLQVPKAGLDVGHPELDGVIVDQGGGKAKGFELEVAAAPKRGITLNGSVGYTDFKFTSINPIVGTLATYLPTFRPKWTAQLSGEYETQPLFDDARLHIRIDGNWRSKQRMDEVPNRLPESFQRMQFVPANWIVNGRIALSDLNVGSGRGEIALWGRNLTDNNKPVTSQILGVFSGAVIYQAARSFGVDLSFTY